MTAVFLSGCAAHQIDARRGGIIEDEDDVLRRSVDYLTYLKLKILLLLKMKMVMNIKLNLVLKMVIIL